MAMYNWTSSISGTVQHGNYTLGASIPGEIAVKKRFINCATNNMASGSYYKIFNVPANTMIEDAAIFVHTVEGGTASVDLCWILDSDTTPSSVTAIIDDLTVETDDTCGSSTASVCNDAAAGLWILANEALDACKFWVVAKYVPLTTTD